MVIEPNDCSNAMKKNKVNKPQKHTAIILSLVITEYLEILEISKTINKSNAMITTKLVPLKLPTLKGRRFMFSIFSKGSLNTNNNPPIADNTIKTYSKTLNGFLLSLSSASDSSC